MTAEDQSGIRAKLLPGEKPTLKTISRLSGMAVPTVSRALGDAPDISSETKKKVRRIATEIGYVPNRAGVRLRTGRTNVIALILSTENDLLNMTSQLISSIAGALRDTPFNLVVTPDFPDEDPLKPVKYIVENGAADAIIINRIQPNDPRVAYLLERGFPFVTHGRSAWLDRHGYCDFDNAAFARLGVETLRARNRKSLLLIAPPPDQNYGVETIAGTRAAAEKTGLSLKIAKTITSDSRNDLIQTYVQDCLESGAGFDGLISGSPNATMAAIAGLEKAGLEVGKDIDVFSKDTVLILPMFRPGILVVRENVALAGEFLARAAMHAAKNPTAPPMQFLDVPAEER